MSADRKKSMGSTILLIALGLLAFFGGAKWVAILIPVAALVWYGTIPALRRSRN